MDYLDDLEHLSLKWNNYNDTMKTGFRDLLQREDFVDVTIAVEGKLIQAHKMVLSICSPYFKTIFKTNPCQHPVVFLRDVTHKEISGILQFMYLGEVSITQENLAGFLRTAEALQIKGLSSEDVDEAFPPLSPEGNNAKEGEETKHKDEKKIKILPSHGGDNDGNSTKKSPLCNGDDNDKINTKILPSHGSHNGDDDDDYDDDDNYDDDDDDYDDDDYDDDDDDDDDEMDIHDHGGGEPKKMKMSSADERLAPIDPHVPVIRTPERPVTNSNTQSSQVVKKDVRLQTDNNAPGCERACVVQEIDGNGDYQSLNDREEFAGEIINTLTTGNGSEIGQEVNNFQPIADLYTQGESQQEIRFVVSQRRRLCLVFNNYLYIKDHVGVAMPGQPKTIYWRCKNVTCKARCIQTDFKFRLKRNTYHQHDPNADKTYLPIPLRQACEMMKLFI